MSWDTSIILLFVSVFYLSLCTVLFQIRREVRRTNEILAEFRMKDLQERIAELTKDDRP